MIKRIPFLILVAFGAMIATTARAVDPVAFRPFVIDHRAATPESLDLSSLLRAPAGAHGRITVKNGHLADADGARFRIWGVNLTAFAKASLHFPTQDDADFWADRLARLGVNCVRLHSFDVEAPRGIIAANRNDTRSFDPEQLDRMDRFVAALKQRGIYVDLNLNVGRSYQPGDGVRDAELMGYAKSVTYFDPRLIELEREYARALLTHYNPYTRSTYAEEPAIALIEILNENSLVGAWIRGRLQGTKTSGRPENWQDIPPYYAAELDRLYQAWLVAHLPTAALAELRRSTKLGPTDPVPRLKPAEFAAASRLRFDSEAAFYSSVEEEFFRAMRSYLRDTLHAGALLVGTSDFSHGRSYYPTLRAVSQLDVIDTHCPWESSANVDEPANSIVARVSRSAVAGKPLIISEHNHRFPSDHTSEGIPLLAAYAGFQDWDGVFLYTFEVKPPDYQGRIETRADLSHDPVKLVNLAAGALVFARGDVAPARTTVMRTLAPEEVTRSLLLTSSAAAGVYFTPGVSPLLALLHGSRVTSLDGPGATPVPVPDASPLVSDTGELSWYYRPATATATVEDDQKFVAGTASGRRARSGVVVVDTPRTQALIGFLPKRPVQASHLSAQVRNPFATLVLTSLDGQPIARSRRLLLTATARVLNTGSRWNAAHTALADWGGTPTVIEPVEGTLILTGLTGATAVSAVPLDGAGNRMAPKPAMRRDAAWEIPLGGSVTTWFEIRVDRD